MRGFFYEVIYRQKMTKVTKKQIKKKEINKINITISDVYELYIYIW